MKLIQLAPYCHWCDFITLCRGLYALKRPSRIFVCAFFILSDVCPFSTLHGGPDLFSIYTEDFVSKKYRCSWFCLFIPTSKVNCLLNTKSFSSLRLSLFYLCAHPKGEFLWENPKLDHWSQITRILRSQGNEDSENGFFARTITETHFAENIKYQHIFIFRRIHPILSVWSSYGCVFLGKSKIGSLISDHKDTSLPKKRRIRKWIFFLPWQPSKHISHRT